MNDDDIDFLYIFPKYRRLRKRLKEVNKDNLKKQKAIENYWKEKVEFELIIKQKNRIIFKLRKELKELKKNENKK